jgi:hypothetical protein
VRNRFGRFSVAGIVLLLPLNLSTPVFGQDVTRPNDQMHFRHEVLADVSWVGGAAMLDLGATWWAERRCPTCYEANPLMRSTGTRLAVKAATSATVVWGCYELRRRGHDRAARIFRWMAVAVWSGVAVNNVLQTRR